MKHYQYFLALLFLAGAFGCKNETTQGPELGTYRGTLALLGVDAKPLAANDGATIAIEGTPFRATTNQQGDWQIDDVPAGIYNIVMAKPGFDSIILTHDQFSGSGTSFLENLALMAIPDDSVICTFTPSHDSVNSSAGWYLAIAGHVSGTDPIPFVMLSIIDDTGVKPDDQEFPVAGDRTFSIRLNRYSSALAPVKSGKTASISVFASGQNLSNIYNVYEPHWGTYQINTPKPYSTRRTSASIVLPYPRVPRFST